MNKPIVDLIDEKIREMERYNEITSQIIYEDIDGVGDLIEERQKIITEIDGISLGIKQFVNEQSIQRQDELNALLKFEEIGELNGEMLELQDKIRRVEALRNEIVKNDKRAFTRIKQEHDELKEKLENAAKSKQVVDYFSQTAVDITKGSKLNISN